MWEPLWQAAVGRICSKKSEPGSESPMKSHSSGRKIYLVLYCFQSIGCALICFLFGALLLP